jgi:hypothetical protein
MSMATAGSRIGPDALAATVTIVAQVDAVRQLVEGALRSSTAVPSSFM